MEIAYSNTIHSSSHDTLDEVIVFPPVTHYCQVKLPVYVKYGNEAPELVLYDEEWLYCKGVVLENFNRNDEWPKTWREVVQVFDVFRDEALRFNPEDVQAIADITGKTFINKIDGERKQYAPSKPIGIQVLAEPT